MGGISQRKFKISISAVLLLCLMVLFVIYSSSLFNIGNVSAASVSWDGGGDGTTWESAANWSGDSVPTAVDDVTLTSVTVEINGTTTINSLSLVSSTLTFDYDAITSGALILDDGALSIDSGSTVTHTVGTASVVGTVYFDVQTGNVTVDGTIDLDMKGYSEGNGPGAGSGDDWNGGGAGHGGDGGSHVSVGSNGITYGSVTAPVTLGSSGAISNPTSVYEGVGGGAVRIDVAGDTDIDGTITADGGYPINSHSPGGGAGGSVYITTIGTLTGTGSISADGGDGLGAGGGGGGGRIAMYYDADTSSITETAYGGTSGSCTYCFGGAGTIYLKDTTGGGDDTLIVDNNSKDFLDDRFFGKTPLTPSGTPASFTYDNLILQNDGQLDLNSDTTLTVNTGITWTNDGTLVDNGGTFDFISNSVNSLTIPSGGKLYANTTRTYVNITVSSGATVVTSRNSTTAAGKVHDIDWTATGNVTIDGTIDLDMKGYSGGNGSGAGSGDGWNGGGAGHGGDGGSHVSVGSNGTVYGSVTAPVTLGSGGAISNPTSVYEGVGGGAVRIDVAGDTDIDGTITADGGYPINSHSPGGGAGGSVYITTIGTLTGTGSISTDGGNGITAGGGGGGGRIAMYYDADTSSITETAYGGTSGSCTYCFGGAGTIYLKDTTGGGDDTLIVDNNSLDNVDDRFFGKTPLPLSVTVVTVNVQNEGYLDLSSGITLGYTTLNWSTDGNIADNGGTMANVTNGTVSIPSGATLFANTSGTYTEVTVGGVLTHSINGASETEKIDMTTSGNFTVSSGGVVDVDGRGYTDGQGTGGGSDTGTYGSGAGHGGTGGDTSAGGGSGGSSYGSSTSPVNIGSGGGNDGWNNVASFGGGAIKLTVGGDLSLLGPVSADVLDNAGSADGGGSGGSIWLNVTGTVSGSGAISADGGSAGNANAGAGSGGRISISCGSDAGFSGSYSVAPGSIGYAADSGTLNDDCSGGVAPTGSFNSATQKTDGSGYVDLSVEIDDVEDDDTKVKIEYETDSDGACDGPWSAATLTGTAVADFDDSGGAPDVGAGTYQVGTTATTRIITSSGSNSVAFDWDSQSDLPTANGTQCLRLTANDDGSDQTTPATQTVSVDNVAPTVSSITYKDVISADGTVDRVDVVFNENVTLTSYNTADWAFTTPGDITLDDTGASVSTATVQMTVTADANETGGSTAPTLSFTNNSRLTDSVGNEVATFGPTAVTDGAGPFILLTDPADGATDTAIGDDVVITFTEAINTGTDAYTWSDAPAGITDAWTASDTVITISHSGSFSIGSHTFTMTVAADGTGNAFVGSVSGVTHPVDFETVAPPSGSTVVSYVSNNAVSINEGDECSASRTVVLQLTAKKAASVLIGHDDLFQDSVRVDFVSDAMVNNVPVMYYSWTLNKGEDTVYVQYRSSTNTASSRVNDSIVVDTTNLCIEHIDSDEITEAPLTDVFGISPVTGEVEAISEVNAHDYIQGNFFTDIYYVDSEINRHPLVDSRTMLTWGSDISMVQKVTDATLGTLGFGRLLLPKPDTTLLKFLDNPDVFTIEENAGDFYHPIIRHIPNEKTAEKMIGPNWQDYIYELNQAHFHEFAIGKKIPEEGIVIDISQMILLK